MKTANVRFLAALLGTVLVVGGAVHAVHEFQVRRQVGVFLREAERARESGDRAKEIDYLKRYLTMAPQDTEVLAELGRLLSEAGRRTEAFAILGQVLQREPDRESERRLLVDVALRLRRYGDARRHLDQFESKNPELQELQAQCEAGAGNYQAAAELYTALVDKEPWRVDAWHRLAELNADRLDRLEDAVGCIDAMVDKNPETARAHLLHGTFLKANAPLSKFHVALGLPRDAPLADNVQQVLERAFDDARKAGELAKSDSAVAYFAAECARDAGRFDDAEVYARRILERDGKSVAAYALLADIELRQARTTEAIAWLQQGLAAFGRDPQLLWNLTKLEIAEGHRDGVAERLRELRQLKHPQPLVDYLECRLLFDERRWSDAIDRLNVVRPTLGEWPELARDVNLWLGLSYGALGRYEDQLAACQSAAEDNPLWAPAQLGIAQALAALQHDQAADEALERIMKLPNAPAEARALLIRRKLTSHLRGPQAERDLRSIEDELDRLAQADQDSPALPILRAELLVAQDKNDAARQLLADARVQSPGQLEFWLAGIALAERDQDWNEVELLLRGAEQASGDCVPLRLARGRYLTRRFGADGRADLRRLADPPAGCSDAECADLAEGLALLAIATHDFEHAQRLCRSIAERQATNLRIRLMLIDLAILRFEVDHPEPARDDPAALSRELNGLLDEVRGIEQGQGPYWCYGDALRLVIEGRATRSTATFELAAERLAAARQVLQNWSRIAFLAGWIHELQSRPDDAVEEYLRAAELGDRQPQLFERLVKLLYQRKDYQRADQFLQQLQTHNAPVSPELARLAAEISFHARDLERAVLYAQKLAEGSGDFKDYIFWGLMLEATGREQEAEVQLDKATQLASEQPEPWIALIDFLGRRDRKPEAEHKVDEAVAHIEPREAPLALARAYESLGRDDDAGQYYEQALQSSPGDARIARMAATFRLRRGETRLAEPVLQRIVQQEHPAHDASDVDWAHRALARIMAQPGRPYQDFQTALSLIDRNLRLRGNTVEDRIAKAWVLSQGRTADTRQDAIRLFEDIQASEGRLNPPDQFRLAQLQLEQGNWLAVTRLMRDLLSAIPDRNQARELGAYKQYVEWYIFALLQRNETSEASIWVDRLNQLLPNELDSVLARAHILAAEGRAADALGVCQRFLEDRAADVAPQQVWIVGRRLELIAAGLPAAPQSPDAVLLFERAEAYFRDYVEREPDEVLELAAFLGRRGRADEALELMDRHLARSGPVQVVKASVAVMGAVAGDQERLERLESLLHTSQASHPDSLELQLTYADLRGWLGRDDADDLYRQILARDAENVIALNNLALLLALQGADPEEAQRLIERAIEIGGPSAPLLDTRATVRLRRRRPQEALTDLQAAVREARDPVYLIHQAQAHLALGQRREAREAWLSARSEGIREQRLHPLERESYREFAAAME